MINGSIEHLVGMDLLRRDVKGRVLAVRVGRDTFVDVVLADGSFESWYLPLCIEVEPGALLRKIEASGKTKPAEPPPVEEPPKPSLVWGTPYDGGGWHLGAVGVGYMEAPYSAWLSGADTYAEHGAADNRGVLSRDLHENCKTVAAWAREDGYIVPLHPVYGEV